MKYYGKFTDDHDLITVAKGNEIASTKIDEALGSSGAIKTELDKKQDNLPSGQTGQFLQKTAEGLQFADVNNIPSQLGQSNKYLKTDGTNLSWAKLDALPDQYDHEGKFLSTNGVNPRWVNIPIPDTMVGATMYIDGVGGIVPKPEAGDQGKFLRGDGTWQSAGGSSIKPVVTSYVVEASKWVNGVYPLENVYPSSEMDVFIAPSSYATYNQLMGWASAYITGNSQSNNLTAKGEVPTIDIPVIVTAYPNNTVLHIETTMEASKWVQNEYSFESLYPSSQYNISICPSSSATQAQMIAYASAYIPNNIETNVAIAKNVVPTIDIPIIVRVEVKDA